MINHFEVVVARGSSLKEINELLSKKELLNGYSGTMNFAATKDFRIYLHHHAWHQVLRDEQGLDESDIIIEGNLGVVEGRLVIRFKCVPPSELRQQVDERIREFLKR